MQRVSHLDLETVNRCGHDLLEASSEDDLRKRLVEHWLPQLVRADFVACNEFSNGLHTRLTTNVDATKVNAYLEPFAAHVHEHPCYALQASLDVVLPLKVSDFVSRRQFHNLALYQEVFKHLEVEHQIILSVKPKPTDMVSLVMSSSSGDFSERDRIILSLLQPIIKQAYLAQRNRQALTSLSSRETEVLAWVAEAKTNKEIAIILGISSRTVQKHLETIFSKLGFETRTAAALWARQASIRAA
jgi:DNA-binding CsgD family transcriptional regulator